MAIQQSGIELGQVTREWVERDRKVVLGWRHRPRVIFERGRGVRLWDVEGNEYLDFVSGHISLLLGHNHPALLEVLQAQAQDLWHHYKYFAARPVIEFAELLGEALPGDLGVTNFTAVGSESNEVAMRIARAVTRHFDFVSVVRGLHGGTFGVEGLNSIGGKRKRHLGPMLAPSRVNAIVTPDCYRCPINLTYPSCNIACLDVSDDLIARLTTGEVAAIFAETILGSGGMIVPPPGWLAKLKRLAEKWGALLVLDEVQVSPAKTGKLWCFEHEGVAPDVLALGKGIGAGTPIGAAITTPELAEKARAGDCGVPWAGTYAGHALYAAIAKRQLEILIEQDFASRAARLGERLMAGLRDLQTRYEMIGDVRGRGLYVGVEIVKDRETKEADDPMAHRVRWNALEEGLLITASNNVVKMFPALTITEDEIDEGVSKIERAVLRAQEGHPRDVTVFTDSTVI